jgi:hypothetical protein
LFASQSFPSFAYPDVDWKWYGGVKASSDTLSCFYDERGVQRQGYKLRVWVKCIKQSALDGVTEAAPYFRAAIDMSASRIAHYYIPPIYLRENLTKVQLQTLIMYEAIADVSDLIPDSQIFYEMDCGQRKIRELSITVGNSSSNQPQEWRYIPPEGNAATLHAMLCPKT